MSKIISFFKEAFVVPNYEVPGATEETHENCLECDGSGVEDVFHDCYICKGTGIVKKEAIEK